MSSEQLADGVNPLDAELAATWDVLKGYSGRDTDLGIARRFGGSSAAYSLRDIGAMNGRVVKARRDVGETSDPEEDFSANQVQSGALEDWVNGKLESTLPADVDTAAATYSLRKAKADYSGDAVRIRRTSDSVEVNVALDSDDKVSASSAITNTTEQGGESGETNATTVAEFLSEERTTFVTNPVFSVSGGGGSITQEVTNTSASFSFQGGTNNFIRDARKPANLGAETGDTISFDVTASGVSTDFSVRLRVVGANTEIISPPINDLNNGTRTITLTVGSNSPAGYFAFTNLNTASTGTVTIDNIKVVGKSATVHTWYDQAGSNNAVQDTADNQPKIAENGALLADGIDFDGINDNFTITNGVSGRSIFAVTNQNIDTTGGGLSGYGQDGISSLLGTAGTNSYIFVSNNNSAFNSYAISIDGAVSDSGQYASNGKTLSSAGGNLGTYGDIPSDTNSLLSIIYGSGDPSNDWTRLGSGINDNIFMQGSMSELILYSSDQSANRFKIESNINNYYGLYNDANEFSANAQVSGTGSTVSNASKDGGTLTLSSASGINYLYFQLEKPTLTTSGDIFISFTYESSDESINLNNLKLRADDGGARGGSLLDENGDDITIQKNGFYSGKLDNANFTNSGTRLAFLTTQTIDGYTFTISNLRYSYIARNGFVETLYDQSGNGNNASQASAGAQPTIISNGNQVTLDNGTPSVAFKRPDGESSDTMSISTPIANEPYTFFATTVNNADNAWFRLFGESNAAPTVLLQNDNEINYNPSDLDASGAISATTTSDNIVSGFSGVNGGADGILRFNGTNLKTDISRTQDGDSISLVGRFPNTGGGFAYIESLVFYESDLTADFDTIEKELAQPINIL